MKIRNNHVLSASLAAMVLGFVSACAPAQKPAQAPPPADTSSNPSAPSANAAAAFKASGKGAPLTVVPTRLAGQPMPQVGEVVAMLLERAGMTNVETSSVVFNVPQGADLAQTAKAFAEFVRAQPAPTEYALFTDFIGSPQTGLAEMRAVVVNKAGEIVWQDRQAKGDADFDREKPKEPMQCCFLVVNRLRPVLGLGDPRSDAAPQSKIAERMRQHAGVPDAAEMAAIERRGQAFKQAAAGATLLIYPAHAGDQYSPESAASLTAMVNARKLSKATAADSGPKLDIAPNMNEQKVLWAMAHGFSDYVKKNPPAADYVLFADYLMGKDQAGNVAVGGVGGVHFAICNKQGELVVVDFQNDHWPDFKAIDPKSREGCDKLVAKRLESYCK